MNRAGLLAAAGGAVAIGLAPVVPLFLAHNRDAFAVPDVHFYAVSATALLCAALALTLGVLGARRHDRRTAAIGAGFTVMASLLAVHGLTTPGFLIEGEYTAAVGVSGALAVPLGGAVLLAALLSRPRELGYVRDLVALQIGVVAVVVAFAALALLVPAMRSRTSLSPCARSSGGSSARTRSSTACSRCAHCGRSSSRGGSATWP